MRIADQLQVTCPVFYIDNVAEYVMEKGSVSLDDVPNCAPPFPAFLMEFRDIKHRNHAAFVLAEDLKPEMLTGLPDKMQAGRWLMRIQHFYQRPEDTVPQVCDSWSNVLINADGSAYGIVEGQSGGAATVCAVLMALSFMHCKNVRTVENVPPFNRARRRRGEREWLKYYTLEIDPMKEVLRREGRIEEVGLKRALHICRGHFATYSGAGLFGKYPGTFWRPSHVRGTAEAGVNVKDYSVKAPRH